jgi:hypothetical protein
MEQRKLGAIGFEDLTAVTMKFVIFWRSAFGLLIATFLFGLLLTPEDYSDTFLRNVGEVPLNYTTLQPSRS